MRKLRTFLHLSGPRKRAILHVLPAAVAVELGLAALTLPRLARLLKIRLLVDPSVQQQRVEASETTLGPTQRLEVWAAHLLFKNRGAYGQCLRTSLVVGRRLRSKDPLLKIGVLKDEGTLKAHAWLEVDGTTIGEAPGYSALRSASAQAR